MLCTALGTRQWRAPLITASFLHRMQVLEVLKASFGSASSVDELIRLGKSERAEVAGKVQEKISVGLDPLRLACLLHACCFAERASRIRWPRSFLVTGSNQREPYGEVARMHEESGPRISVVDAVLQIIAACCDSSCYEASRLRCLITSAGSLLGRARRSTR